MKNKLFIRKQPQVFTHLLKSNTLHYPRVGMTGPPWNKDFWQTHCIWLDWNIFYSDGERTSEDHQVQSCSGPSFKQQLGLLELQMFLPKQQEGTLLQEGVEKAFAASLLGGKMPMCSTHWWSKVQEKRGCTKKKNVRGNNCFSLKARLKTPWLRR